MITVDELVDLVTARTSGTRSDPLTRDEIEQVVRVTLEEVAKADPDFESPSEEDPEA